MKQLVSEVERLKTEVEQLKNLAHVQQHTLETLHKHLECLRRATAANSRLLLRMTALETQPGAAAGRN